MGKAWPTESRDFCRRLLLADIIDSFGHSLQELRIERAPDCNLYASHHGVTDPIRNTPLNMSYPSLAPYILKRPWLARWMKPLSNWYFENAGYRKLGLKYGRPRPSHVGFQAVVQTLLALLLM